MQLTLVLPNLLDIAPAALALADAPALSCLLATTRAPDSRSDALLAIACETVGLAKQDDWPVAPWLARAAGIDVGTRYWLRAEPVTLDVGRDEVRLAGIVRDVDEDESAALLSSLRSHFASDGLEFVESDPGRWWIALEAPQQMASSAPDAALGNPLAAHLPRGVDAPRWRRWQSEIQMLLFEHPVNRSREKNGRPPINYLWVWGGGTLRPGDLTRMPGTVTSVFARTPWLCDLGRATGSTVADPPGSWAALRIARATSALVWLDQFRPAALKEQLAAFDAEWATPLQHAIDRREIALRLALVGSATSLLFAPRPRGALQRLRHRWSRAAPLSMQLAMFTDSSAGYRDNELA
ncbi:MAG: hypothetical protein M3023_07080 [Pseudomonadota bacterium]|nr:hypothetical protein [Pseudomonadota bacterium]